MKRQIIKKSGSVYCSKDSWNNVQQTIDTGNYSKIVVLVDTITQKACLPLLLDYIHFNTAPEILVIPTGETHKTITTCLQLWQEMSLKGVDRASLLINLGGGVITDLGGFVASTFKRGITFINIPTSLLAMVDASVGGKNGVDLDGLKNQIGVINNPLLVVIETRFLDSLPKNQLISGYAEMLKHGLIKSKHYWDSLLDFDTLSKAKIEEAIWESILIKNAIVTIDPTEQKERKMLNYGHTLGHAIETHFLEQANSPSLLHGEAIAIGMILATYISRELHEFPKDLLHEITTHFLKYFKKIEFTQDDKNTIIELLKFDKKNKNGTVLFVLLSNFGDHKINQIVSNDLIFSAFNFYEKF